ncbi:MAG: DUF192 domain-containing protein [Pseudomonadota bacterium]
MKRFALGVLLLFVPLAASASCRDDVVELRGDFGTARFSVDVADDDQERAQGLMNVPSMPASRGMFFLYERPQRATFWMRNTLIPLDMIFAGVDGTVTHVHENAIPLDETTIDGGRGVIAVLEINGGLAGAIGIAPGTELRHPGLDQSQAAWPCE